MVRKVNPRLSLLAASAVVFFSLSPRAAAEGPLPTEKPAPIANLHSDFAMFRGDLSREQGVNLIGASVVSDEYPGGVIGGRIAFWMFGWPADARRSVLSRALAQIDWINQVAITHTNVVMVCTKEDLDEVESRHLVGLLVWMEGADPLIGDPANVRRFYEKGVRAIILTHLYNNDLGGSSSPSIPLTNFYWSSDPGLSDQGRVLLSEMAKYGMVVDLAHASRKTFDDVLAVWSGPVVVSHTAMAAIYPSPRNLTDEQARAIAERNGIIGIMGQTQFLGGERLADLADHVAHAVRVAGPTHVALGLDIEDAVNTMPRDFRDTRDLPELALLLQQRGLDGDQIRGAFGLNAFRFFSTVLKSRSPR